MNALPVRIHIAVRRTLNWSDLAEVEAGLVPAFRAKYDMWNATLTMPYHEFRQRLTAIAEESFRAVTGVTVSSWNDVPDEDIVVPVDDDDWFHPEMSAHLRRAFDPQATGYLWTRAALEYRPLLARVRARLGRLVGRRPRFTCATNNYALRLPQDQRETLRAHTTASEHFDAAGSRIVRLAATLGIQNRSLASQTTLAWGHPAIERRSLVHLLARHRRLHASWRPTPDVEWAGPYVRQMAKLMREVRERKA
jgi:hypothetical protein